MYFENFNVCSDKHMGYIFKNCTHIHLAMLINNTVCGFGLYMNPPDSPRNKVFLFAGIAIQK